MRLFIGAFILIFLLATEKSLIARKVKYNIINSHPPGAVIFLYKRVIGPFFVCTLSRFSLYKNRLIAAVVRYTYL